MPIFYAYEFDKPNPYIFCSFDLMQQIYGGNADWYDASTNVSETAAYPVPNCNDGNRHSFFELTGIGRKTSGYGIVRCDYLNNNDHQAHLVCIENDPEYPIGSIRMRRYASGWGGSQSAQDISKPNSYVPANYLYGIPSRVDGEALSDRTASTYDVSGIDGRYFHAFFEDVIPVGSPYIEILIPECGRNRLGVDGSWDDGVWAGAVDETVETSDPCPDSTGANDNYMQLVTSAGGGDKVSESFLSRIRPSAEYMFGCYLKTTTTAGDGGDYRVMIGYYDREGNVISGAVLWSTVIAKSWTATVMVPVNYISKSDGKRHSGLDVDDHLVPEGTFGINIWWSIIADGTDALTMRVDDAAFYDMSIPFSPENYTIRILDGENYQLPEVLDVSGTVRVRRISLYEFVTATSRAKNKKPNRMDFGGHAPTNPSQTDYSILGKTIVTDFYGNVAAQFIPKGGVKRKQNYLWVVDKRGATFLSDKAASGDPVGIIDPNGDWGDFVIMNDLKISSLITPAPKRRYSYKEIISPNDLYQAIVPVTEV